MYKFCSVCGAALKKRGKHLHCMTCNFVNYLNPRPTVTGILINKGNVLLTRRKNDPFAGYWDFPGGFMDHGESPEAALRRELREETGLDVKIERLVGMFPGRYPMNDEPIHILSIAYLLSVNGGKLAAGDDAEEARWFPMGKIPKNLAFNNSDKIIAKSLDVWRFLC